MIHQEDAEAHMFSHSGEKLIDQSRHTINNGFFLWCYRYPSV